MFAKRALLVVLVASALMLAVGGGTTRARPSESTATSAATDPHLSGEITISALDNMQYSPAVAYNWKHNEYLVVWENVWGGGGHDIYAQRVTDQGELKSWFYVPEDSVYTGNRMQPDVAYDPVNDRYLVVWIYWDGSDWNVHGRFILWNGPSASLTEFQICDWGSDQWKPKAAYGRAEEEFLVVWMNAPSGVPTYISGLQVPADGSSFNPAGGFAISSGADNRDYPDVAYDRSRNEYLVVWDVVSGTGNDIYGERLRASDLHQYGEFGIAEWPDYEEHPAVAACSDSDQYLVAWQSHVNPPDDYDIYVRFIQGDGTLDSVHRMDATTIGEVWPDVACNMSEQQYLVVWQQQYSNGSGPYGVWGQMVSTGKTIGSSFGIVGTFAGLSSGYTTPAIAGGYTNYLTVWEHERYGTSYQDIHGRLITPYAVFLPLALRNS